MKRTLAFIALCTAFVAAIEDPAHSKTAVWASDVKGWTVYGDSELNGCWASTRFEDGVSMAFGFHAGAQTIWTITGVNATIGTSYKVNVGASTGESGLMEAVGVNGNTVAFIGLNKTAIRALANANQIYVQGLGKYNLWGSKAAMAKAWECFETLNSF